MIPGHLLALLFGGAVLANAVPHFVSGTMGRRFQSPFATPPGKGLSSPTVNVLWGAFNLAVAYVLLVLVGNLDLHALDQTIAVGFGLLLSGLMAAHLFGPLHAGEP